MGTFEINCLLAKKWIYRFRRVDLPEPEGPEITIANLVIFLKFKIYRFFGASRNFTQMVFMVVCVAVQSIRLCEAVHPAYNHGTASHSLIDWTATVLFRIEEM